MTRAELEAKAELHIKEHYNGCTGEGVSELIKLYVDAFLAGRDAAAEALPKEVYSITIKSVYDRIKALGETRSEGPQIGEET